jgi:hypothetical protein
MWPADSAKNPSNATPEPSRYLWSVLFSGSDVYLLRVSRLLTRRPGATWISRVKFSGSLHITCVGVKNLFQVKLSLISSNRWVEPPQLLLLIKFNVVINVMVGTDYYFVGVVGRTTRGAVGRTVQCPATNTIAVLATSLSYFFGADAADAALFKLLITLCCAPVPRSHYYTSLDSDALWANCLCLTSTTID